MRRACLENIRTLFARFVCLSPPMTSVPGELVADGPHLHKENYDEKNNHRGQRGAGVGGPYGDVARSNRS